MTVVEDALSTMDRAIAEIERLRARVNELEAVLKPRLKAKTIDDLQQYADLTEDDDLGEAIRMLLEWYVRGRAAIKRSTEV